MSESVLNLLRAFDALPAAEQNEAASEILRRWVPDEEMPEAAFDELAAEVFRAYDEAEGDRADP